MGKVTPKIRYSSPARRLGCLTNLIAINLFKIDIETIQKIFRFDVIFCKFISPIFCLPLPFMTFQGCCQLYCYSKDPVMNSMNVPLNFHSNVR